MDNAMEPPCPPYHKELAWNWLFHSLSLLAAKEESTREAGIASVTGKEPPRKACF